jgi:hypothetical protein
MSQNRPAFDFREGITGDGFAGVVEPDDAALVVEHHHQRTQRIHHGRGEIAFLLERFFPCVGAR